MRRTLVWSAAMSTVVAAVITLLLSGSPPRPRGGTEHNVQVVVSILGRSVTIGVSVEARKQSPSTQLELLEIGSEAGEVP